MLCIAVIGTASCKGGSDNTGPLAQDPNPHLRLTIEPMPFDLLKSGKLMFYRNTDVNPCCAYGLVLVDVGQRRVSTSYQSSLSWQFMIAPDGKKLVFGAGLNAGPGRIEDVFVKDLAARDGTPIGGPGGTRSNPGWTPDNQLLYAEAPHSDGRRGNEKFVRQAAVLNAGDRTFLSEALQDGCMSGSRGSTAPDGAIVFSTECGAPPSTLYLIRQGVQTALLETASGLPRRELLSPVWFPDGTEIAFLELTNETTGVPGTLAVKSIRADGSGIRTIATVPNAQFLLAPAPRTSSTLCFMGGGETLVFTVAESDRLMHIQAVRRDGSGLTKVTTDPASTDQWVSCAP